MYGYTLGTGHGMGAKLDLPLGPIWRAAVQNVIGGTAQRKVIHWLRWSGPFQSLIALMAFLGWGVSDA